MVTQAVTYSAWLLTTAALALSDCGNKYTCVVLDVQVEIETSNYSANNA